MNHIKLSKRYLLVIVIITIQILSVNAQKTSGGELPDSLGVSKSLRLPDVEVTAQRRTLQGTTSYIMDRTTLDHAQTINISDIMSLLPGGKTINSTLMNDDRILLRSQSSERGNASFGTGIEIDGMRLDNNAMMDDTQAASTRSLSSSNIGSVEIISGIAGVEYGDISNGIVKVNSRRGRTQWILEGSINPYTRQVALHKGLQIGKKNGILNFSLEHANSFSDISSPYTAYQRNTLSLGYYYAIPKSVAHGKLSVHTVFAGNVGGYNSKADPDAFKDTYTKIRDNQLRGSLDLKWIKNNTSLGVFNVTLHGAFSTSDKRTENYTNNSSSSEQPLIHTLQNGYAQSLTYDDYTNLYGEGAGGIMLGPTGYWYTRYYNDQKPLTFQLKAKGEWTKVLSRTSASMPITNKVMFGMEYNTSRNNGQGVWYEDIRYASDGWRPYVYRDLPTMKNLAIFLEDKFIVGKMRLTAGLRDDITMLAGSGYGTLSSLSPRINMQYKFFHAGFGKSVKLPSFQILYPADSYSDKLSSTVGTTSSGSPIYTYYTNVQKTLVNNDLKWQSTNQVDIGVEYPFKDIRVSLSGYWHKTINPYQRVNIYTPFAYDKTDQVSGQIEYHTYSANYRYVNGSPVTRYGLEWIIDATLCRANSARLVGLKLRLDGSYYHYKGIDNTLLAGAPNGVGDLSATTSGAGPLIGYYSGSNITSTSSSSISIANGSMSKGCNVNATFTAHIPKARLIMTLKVESTFLNYKRSLSENRSAILLQAAGDIFGTKYNGEKDCYVALYPEYYSTWENPEQKIPFAEALSNAKESDATLYKQLCNLIVRSNTSYYFNPNDISSYFSCNFSITKEIGNMFSVSLYANNFLNNMHSVHSSQTGLDSSLFGSAYIPKFYYGASLRIKI